eukprot:4622387-Prymnesium_polylepis.2
MRSTRKLWKSRTLGTDGHKDGRGRTLETITKAKLGISTFAGCVGSTADGARNRGPSGWRTQGVLAGLRTPLHCRRGRQHGQQCDRISGVGRHLCSRPPLLPGLLHPRIRPAARGYREGETARGAVEGGSLCHHLYQATLHPLRRVPDLEEESQDQIGFAPLPADALRVPVPDAALVVQDVRGREGSAGLTCLCAVQGALSQARRQGRQGCARQVQSLRANR